MIHLKRLLGPCLLGATAFGLVPALLVAQPATPAPKPAPLTKEQQERLREWIPLYLEARKVQADGKLAEAIAACQKMVAIEQEVFGPIHEDVANSLELLADLYIEGVDFVAAREIRQRVLNIKKSLYGDTDWRTADARMALAEVEKLASLDEAGRRKFAQAEQFHRKVNQLYREHKFRDALELARQVSEIRRQALGEHHPKYAITLHNLATLYKELQDYAKAEALYRQALEINRAALGEQHPHYASSLNNLGQLYQTVGDYAKAEPLLRQALEIRKRALGEQHADYAASLNNLAFLYRGLGDYAAAERLYRQAVDTAKRTRGEQHPDYAATLNNLAALYMFLGDYAKAEPLHRQALEIRRRALGEQHPDYANSLNNLALLYKELADYGQAEPLYRQTVEIWKRAMGERHPHFAVCLDNLAGLYADMGDYVRAEPLYRQALEIRKRAFGEEHPDYADSLDNLCGLYRETGNYARAQSLCRQALEIRKRVFGEQHPDYAVSLNNLAGLHEDMGDYAKAEPLYRQALEIRKRALGRQHPNYAKTLNNLALLYVRMGNYARAEPLVRQALEIWKQTLGPQHPDYARGLLNVALLCWAKAEYRDAESLYRQGLEICRNNLELAAAVQSERQQLIMAQQLRYVLDRYLTLAPQAEQTAATAYGPVLAWKGSVFVRQQRLRLERQRPELADDFARLRQTASRLAALSLSAPAAQQRDVLRRRIQELSEEKERLESDLARRSAEFRQQQATARLAPAELQNLLPKDAALIDFLEYVHGSPNHIKGKANREHCFVAFVVRPDTIARVELGPSQPLAAAIDSWRQLMEYGRPTKDHPDPTAELRRLVWQPLESHLKGVQTVLVSPDGALAGLPLAALPGSKPETYLLEEVAIAVVPVPQLLPEILGAPGKNTTRLASLLLVGDVDFGAAPGLADAPSGSRSAVRGSRAGALPLYPPLQATREEIVAVRDSFEQRYADGQVQVLRKAQATEAVVREAAPRHRYLHFATHGFFAPSELPSALALRNRSSPASDPDAGGDLFGPHGTMGVHPGLLSGLVLAGANRPAGPDQDDGILTALEVAELDLEGVELAVLSACETGLGETAGGEGLLGLQRAFQVAGARTVLASLWKVDDESTRKLMVRFYENLWNRQKPMGKLEALRQAQLWMLQEGVRRGLVRLEEDKPPTQPVRTSPRYWAAFVLSGDWR